MTVQLQQVIAAARALSPRDKLELLEVISHDLQHSYAFTDESATFGRRGLLRRSFKRKPLQ